MNLTRRCYLLFLITHGKGLHPLPPRACEAWWNTIYRYVTQCRPVLLSLQVGNNIREDFKKLHKDFADLEGQAGPYAELTSLLPQQPAKKRSLDDLVLVSTCKKMDKDLGEGALFDWTSPIIPADQLQYTVNDAAAGLEVYEALLRRKEGTALPLRKETGCTGGAEAGGAGAYGSAESIAVEGSGDEVPWGSDLGDYEFVDCLKTFAQRWRLALRRLRSAI